MNNKVMKQTLEFYEDLSGKEPFLKWLDSLDIKTQARIRNRLTRLELGNFGDCKPVGEGVYELRLFFGPGYRLYFAKVNDKIVIFLCGGDKHSQDSDIHKAKEYWREYKRSMI